MTRVYATASQYAAYTGQTATADTDRLLLRASQQLDAQVLGFCWYLVDEAGLPTDAVVQAALADAVCAQVEWWGELGDSTGAAGAGWGSVSIGSVSLSRPSTGPDGAGTARQVAPRAWDALRSPDMTRDRFVLGAVCT